MAAVRDRGGRRASGSNPAPSPTPRRRARRTRRPVRPAEDVHEDVDPAKAVKDTLCHACATRGRCDVRGDVVHVSVSVSGYRACRGDDCRTSVAQHIDDGRADALGAGGDERAAPGQFEIEAHGAISSRAILSPSRMKRYWSSTGLPGNSPVTRPVTVVWSPETWTPSCSTV